MKSVINILKFKTLIKIRNFYRKIRRLIAGYYIISLDTFLSKTCSAYLKSLVISF